MIICNQFGLPVLLVYCQLLVELFSSLLGVTQLNVIYLSNAVEPLICSNGSDFQVLGKLLLYGLTDLVGPFKIV